jgi:hypothetical protein
MDALRQFAKQMSPMDSIAVAFFALSVAYALGNGMAHTVLAGVAFVLIMMGGLPKQRALAFLVGAVVTLLLQPRSRYVEGFEDVSGSAAASAAASETEEKAEDTTEEDAKAQAEADVKEKAASEKFAGAQKPMLPNNRDRKEMLQLGKPYKLPSESDDKGYHLDAGTTFLNAYKALKPDQIAAMTKDTQELLATQKSLIGMLESFGPLMKDMKQITGFLGTQ